MLRPIIWLVMGGALFLTPVPSGAAGWDERDVEAAERYRETERERAQRYREQIARRNTTRRTAPTVKARRPADLGTARSPARPHAERDTAWWERALDVVLVEEDVEVLTGWVARAASWVDLWEEEVRPRWRAWARSE